MDFVGVSAYAPLGPQVSVSDMDSAASWFAGEMKKVGVDLHQLISAGKELHYSEFGIGGGTAYG